jgi:hypothetical protein
LRGSLRSIAQNIALHAIFARHQPILHASLAAQEKAWLTSSAARYPRVAKMRYTIGDR